VPCFAETAKQPGTFSCVKSIDALANTELSKDGAKFDNFLLYEHNSEMSVRTKTLTFSFSGLNRSQKQIYVTGEAAGFDRAGKLLFAVSAGNSLSVGIGPDQAENMQGSILIEPGTLNLASKICVRINGEF